MGSKKFKICTANFNGLQIFKARYIWGSPLKHFPLTGSPITLSLLTWSPVRDHPCIMQSRFGVFWPPTLCVSRQIGSFNGLSKWLFQKSSSNELSKKDLQMRSTNKDLIEICWKLAWRLLGVWWEYDLWNPWTTFKEVISIGSPNGPSKKFSKWALQIETWLESAGSPLGVRWESAGNPVGVCWESAGSLLGVRWESNGNPLGVR